MVETICEAACIGLVLPVWDALVKESARECSSRVFLRGFLVLSDTDWLWRLFKWGHDCSIHGDYFIGFGHLCTIDDRLRGKFAVYGLGSGDRKLQFRCCMVSHFGDYQFRRAFDSSNIARDRHGNGYEHAGSNEIGERSSNRASASIIHHVGCGHLRSDIDSRQRDISVRCHGSGNR
jgi:hypothetical protein